MAPPEIIQLSYNWWSDRDGHAVVAIVAHNTVGYDSRAYLSRGGDLPDGSDKKVSIHYLIPRSGDRIYKYVPEERGANHAGFGTMPAGFPQINPNKVTTSYELENASNGKTGAARVSQAYPDEQLLAMGWLILDIRRRRGPLPVIRHETLDPTRRKDPVGLSIAEIESWCVKAAAHYPPHARYKAGPYGALAQQDRRPDAPTAKYYLPGEPFEVDGELNGYVHDRSGIGFVPLGQVVKL